MDNNRNDIKLNSKVKKAGATGGLPVGMKFDKEQGRKLQEFLAPLAEEYYRVLKPLAFCTVFSQARLYHRIATALENADFESGDMPDRVYEGRQRLFLKNILLKDIEDRKTRRLKPQIEPMTLAQKPKDATFVDNRLITKETLDNKFHGNIMKVSKRERQNDEYCKTEHLAVKPVKLIEHLIKLFTICGGIASLRCNRKFIGIEPEEKYYEICLKRLTGVKTKTAEFNPAEKSNYRCLLFR